MKQTLPAVRVRMSGKIIELDGVMKFINKEKMHHAGKFLANATGMNKEYANKLAFAIRDAWRQGHNPINLSCSIVGPTKATSKFTVRIDEEAIKEQAKQQKKAAEKAKLDALKDEEKLLLRLKKVNEAVDDEEVSEMLGRIEDIATKILARVKQKPETRRLIEDFYEKYLPMAVQISEKYAKIYMTGIRNEESAKLKEDMLESLQTCDDAFHKMFEHTYDEDMLSLSSEMAALNNKLNYDGLTKSDFDI